MKIPGKFPKSVLFCFWMTLLLGAAYPLLVTGIAQLLFPWKSNGSLLEKDNIVVGSALLAQDFRSRRYFHGRPSTTAYAYVGSGASNMAATNSVLSAAVRANLAEWENLTGGVKSGKAAPSEMLHASASGLDPEISLEAALAQVDGIATAREYTFDNKQRLLKELTQMAAKAHTLIGPSRVNVTLLNVRLDADDASARMGHPQ